MAKNEDGIILTNEEKETVIRGLSHIQAQAEKVMLSAEALKSKETSKSAKDFIKKIEDMKQKFL